MPVSFFSRLLLSLISIFLFSASIGGYILLDDARQTIDKFRLQQAHLLTESLTEGSLDALATNDYELLERSLIAATPIEDFSYAYLSRPDGVILSHTTLKLVATDTVSLGPLAKPIVRDIEYNGRQVREVVQSAYLGKKHMANAHLAYFLDTKPFFSEDIVLRLLSVMLITLLFLSLTTYLVLRHLIRPLEILAGVIENTKNHVHDMPEELMLRDDEVGKLANNFYGLMQRLANSYNSLFKEKEFNQVTLDSIGDAVIVTDEKGNIQYLNSVAELLTGWPIGEAKGLVVNDIFPIIDASTRESISNPVEKVLQTGEVVYLSNHTTLISRDKTEYQIADSAAPIRNEVGAILGMVLVFNDVTQQYKLRETAEKNRRDLLAIMDNSPAVISAKDINGRYVFINQKFEQLFTKTSEEIIGKTDHDIFPIDFADQFVANDKAVLQAGYALESEERAPQDDGVHTYITMKFPLLDEADNVYAVCGISTDITERIRQEEKLRRSQKMDALGLLIGGIAHDYNNMLGVINGYAELLHIAVKDQPKLNKYVSQIINASGRNAALTKKLLVFSQQNVVNKELININELLLEEQLMLEKTITPRIQLILNQADKLWQVWLDGSELEDVILNVCINAMHSIDGNGVITIETRNETIDKVDAKLLQLTEGDYVSISISDTGCGMDEVTKAMIFDPFFTTKGDKGTGLGLSQAYGFVERNNGAISVHSKAGDGSRFAFYFPRNKYQNDEVQEKDGVDITRLRGDETILLVDDEKALLELTSEILELQGYHVICAEGAASALQILAAESVDLLLSDIVMPEMNGYQLAAIVQREYPDVKIQLTSGYTDENDSELVDESLQEDVLHKPYHSHTLFKTVRQLLDAGKQGTE